jgi:hypothetical protein
MASDIKKVTGEVLQTGVDVLTTLTIPTNLGVIDQKTLWQLEAVSVEWANGLSVTAKPNWFASLIICRDPTKYNFLDEGVIAKISWAANAGLSPTAVQALPFESIKQDVLIEEPWVANSNLYAVALSQTSGLANRMRFKIFYKEVKVTELEFLKAQTGYCVC